ncbi:MAG: metallophosphoesterase [Lachnospiraceae bacterium]|nr:metallophosphoesterase [Lachnospiraceae bacterium]
MFFINLILVVIALFAIVCLWSAIYDSNRFVVSRYELCDEHIKKEFRFVFLTDVHLKEYGKKNTRLLDAIDREKPDAILIGGDLINATPGADVTAAVFLVNCLSEHYPVYYAYGNHEARAKANPEKYGELFPKYLEMISYPNVTFLENSSVELPEAGIAISGLSMDQYYYKKRVPRVFPERYLEKKLGARNPNCFQILLAHQPDYFRFYAAWDADLTLSGHVHGGVMRLPILGGVISPALRLFPHYDGGVFEEYDHRMILGRGLGMHTIPIRIFNPGEVIVVTLMPKP